MALPQEQVASHESGRSLPPINRRRDKPQLSCTLCRRGKLKCDRGLPCESCARRGLSLSCTYPAATPLQSGKRVIHPTSNMHDRVAQLEKLVLSLKNEADANNRTSASQGHYSPDFLELPKSFGRISLENAETTYVEGSHWTAILDGIAELKDCFDDEVPESAEFKNNSKSIGGISNRGPVLLLGNFQQLDKREILASIPPRPTIDQLVIRYFNSKNINSLLIHGPTFLEEYHRFWESPWETSTMWIGLLFSIICLGTLHQQLETSYSESPTLHDAGLDLMHSIQLYRERAAQCLVLADYTKCVPYTVETLLHYLAIEYVNITDSHTGVWALMGIIVQIALRMGYHRDGSHSSRLSPFQVEMRRRAWAVLFQVTSSAAGQFGLPRMINDSQADTKEPQDISDDALSPDMIELPPPRSDSEASAIQFLVAKNRLLSIFNMIVDLTGSPKKAISYEQIIELDKILERQFKGIPVPLQMKPMSRCLADTADIIVNRLFLSLSYYRSRCVLHREYMLVARSNNRYMHSRKSCIGAALNILQIQLIIHEETQLGRRLYLQKWKISAMVKHIFLLAATILCVDINCRVRETHDASMIEDHKIENIIQALNTSYSIWLQSSDMSREAQKVVEMLRLVLNKAQRLPTTVASSLSISAHSDDSVYSIIDCPVSSDDQHPITFSRDVLDLENELSLSNQSSNTIEGVEGLETPIWDLQDWTGTTAMDDILKQSNSWNAFEI
ncbi:putative fungal-specific transcription factor [Talaromyces proteolyticus]|uniref:Fungal-specific transcription factor n=1 Tax=Talaromyces proteolyticus TaxID=1131652 RepID=A0AAD4KH48_9EURO|nr:putative fungal-specific transcription factor [Talaromyces proteolyticus]KAH8689364.1 putative fungal-specific transcription factor [Talaromyces proteolyticus]